MKFLSVSSESNRNMSSSGKQDGCAGLNQTLTQKKPHSTCLLGYSTDYILNIVNVIVISLLEVNKDV